MKTMKFLLPISLISTLLVSCSTASFHGSNGARAKKADTPTNPPAGEDDGAPGTDDTDDGAPGTDDGTTPGNDDGTPGSDDGTSGNDDGSIGTDDGTAGNDDTGGDDDGSDDIGSDDGDAPVCEPGKQATGAHVAFLIDNSNSNSATDCPQSSQVGTFNGSKVYECGAETNREAAVRAAFDVLNKVRTDSGNNAEATSELAVASFPTKSNYKSGYQIQGQGWVNVTSGNKTSVTNSTKFARKPFGITPYGAAMTASTELFTSVTNDGKARVAVLVTDGEPTDRNPSSVLTKANALRAAGIEVFTVFVTAGQSRGERYAAHKDMMTDFNATSIRNGDGTYYDNTKYSSLSSYVKALIGASASDFNNGLAAKVAGKSANVIEVSNSKALKAAFLKIIKTRAIRCEQ